MAEKDMKFTRSLFYPAAMSSTQADIKNFPSPGIFIRSITISCLRCSVYLSLLFAEIQFFPEIDFFPLGVEQLFWSGVLSAMCVCRVYHRQLTSA
jgi:hypothetical protein